jgi:hypothetical protein
LSTGKKCREEIQYQDGILQQPGRGKYDDGIPVLEDQICSPAFFGLEWRFLSRQDSSKWMV